MRELSRFVVVAAATLAVGGCHGRRARAAKPWAGPTPVTSLVHACGDFRSCEAACQAGQGFACTFAGRYPEFGHGVPLDLPRALSLYERGCALGDPGGCYNVAVLLERGQGAPRDLGRAAALYRQVCRAGSQTACAAAERISAGSGVSP